jgi:outer membrane protein
MRIRRMALFCSILFLTFLNLTPVRAETDEGSLASGTKTIACLMDGDYARAHLMLQNIRSEVSALAKGYYEANFLPDENADWDSQRAEMLLKKHLEDPNVDLILVSGPMLTLAAKFHIPLSKPVIVASLLDPDIFNMPASPDGTSGVSNLYYTAKTNSMEADLKLFRRIVKFNKVHLLVEDGLKTYAQKSIQRFSDKELQIGVISGTGTLAKILERIDQAKPEAIYLTPLNLSREDHQALLGEINKRKIATFSYSGYEEVEDGALAGRVPKISVQFSRRIAITVDRVLKGEDAGAISTRFSVEDGLVVNQKTANLIGFSLPFDLLMEAEVLFRDDVQGAGLTLQQAVKIALDNNLNFKIFDEQIKAVSKDYWLAWSQYLPFVEGRVAYHKSDFSEERYGDSVPTEYKEAGVNINQLIFSHPVLLSIRNAKMQITVEKLGKETIVLDITDQTVAAYLNYLRAKALMKVEQERLKAVTEGLGVANRRYQTGAGGKEEVLRWEAELANEKSLVLFRDSSVFRARVVLNQLMNRRQEEVFNEQDVGLETLNFYIGGKSLDTYVTDLATLRMFLDFSVQEAYKNAPELKALGIGIKQQKNQIKSADGRFFLPEVSADGDYHDAFDEKFSGTAPAGDEDGWDMGVKVTYPLFDRGRRPVDSMKQRDLLHQLEYALFLKKQEIERDLRLSAYDIYTSLPSIELRRQAMVSSSEEYAIMETKYKEGLVSYVDLINTQTVKFQREADAVIAIYDFFDNLSRFDRQGARFYMLASEEERQQWLAAAREYLKSRGIVVSA